MAWSFSYFFDSFKDPFPWVLTDEQWAKKKIENIEKLKNLSKEEASKFSALK